MTGYNDSLCNSDFYGSSLYRIGAGLRVGMRCRVVRPVRDVPPVMDTLVYGLSQRFDWLQQGIQAFALLGKIEYAKGPELDDHWGRTYELPRLAGESDIDYRIRLKTYVKVLTGSGTIPNTQAVLDVLIASPGGTRVTSLWPARAIIDFNHVDAMRLARARLSLLNSVLPGMFAAGIDYELIIPYLDCYMRAYVSGPRTIEYIMNAAVATDRGLACSVKAVVAFSAELAHTIGVAVQAQRELFTLIRSAVRVERTLSCSQHAAVQGDAELPIDMRAAVQVERTLSYSQYAAVQGEPVLLCSQYAAVARTFEMQCGILARVVQIFTLRYDVRAAVQAHREMGIGIRVRVARRL